MKKKYNDQFGHFKKLINGNDWYEVQAYRALNQALGRCIRHRKDWGAIILMDSRFSDPKSRKYISKWIREKINASEMRDFSTAFDSLVSFFEGKKVDKHTSEKSVLLPLEYATVAYKPSEYENNLIVKCIPQHCGKLVGNIPEDNNIKLYCIYCGLFLCCSSNKSFVKYKSNVFSHITNKRVSKVNPHAWKNPIFKFSLWKTCSVGTDEVIKLTTNVSSQRELSCCIDIDSFLKSDYFCPLDCLKYEIFECSQCKHQSNANILFFRISSFYNDLYFLPETICYKDN